MSSASHAPSIRAAVASLLLMLFRPAAAFAHPGHAEHLSQTQAMLMLAGSGLAVLGVALTAIRRVTAGRWRWVPFALMGFGLLGGGAGSLAAPLLLGPCRDRPSTEARVAVLRPGEGQVFRSRVPVDVRIVGGRLVLVGGLSNQPGEGHLHISVDGNLISMIGQERQTIPVPLGRHTVGIEFVANDHIAFCPPVSVTRTVEVVR